MRLDRTFTVIDSHTAGHPTRVIISGIPPLQGESVREQRDNFRHRHDDLRPQLLHEPRGHAAMVGLVPVPSRKADYGAFFISSYIYLDMCGHATIGYAKTLAATGQIGSSHKEFSLEIPAGIVRVGLVWDAEHELASVILTNVPSYVGTADLAVHVPDLGTVIVDIVYGGVWYAIIDAHSLNLKLGPDTVNRALQLGTKIREAVNSKVADRATPPNSISSVLFVEEQGVSEAIHLVVLASNKFDRSPCGTGTSARLAQLHQRRKLEAGLPYVAKSILGTAFHARITAVTEHEGHDAVIPEITGNAHVTAFSTIVCEQSDPLKSGFLCL